MNKSLPVKHITNMLDNEDITDVIFKFVGQKPKRWSWMTDHDFNRCVKQITEVEKRECVRFHVELTDYIVNEDIDAQEIKLSYQLPGGERECFFENNFIGKEYYVENIRKVKPTNVRLQYTMEELEYYDNSDDTEDEGETEPEFATRSVQFF